MSVAYVYAVNVIIVKKSYKEKGQANLKVRKDISF